MSVTSIEDKIIKLEREVSGLKTSQVLGGDNSRIYRHYVEGSSVTLQKKYGVWMTPAHINSGFLPVPPFKEHVYSSVSPKTDDPFGITSVEKIEIYRNDTLVTDWSAIVTTNGWRGQRSGAGELFLLSTGMVGNGWRSDQTPRVGVRIFFEMSPDDSIGGSTLQYKYKVWLKSTSMSDYVFNQDATNEYA